MNSKSTIEREPNTKPPGKYTPAGLLEGLRSGDHDAFGRIYLQYHGSVCRFLTTLLNSPGQAEELTQEIFVILWESRENIDPARDIKAYLYGIARHKVMDILGHRKVEERYVRISGGPDKKYTPPDDIAAEEMELLIAFAAQKMSPMRRKVFESVVIMGLTIEETSKMLHMKKATVSSHLYQARKELRRIIG